MSAKRLFAIALIFALATVAWVVLAGSVQVRTDSSDARLGDAVSGLWGSPQTQPAPTFTSSVATGTTGVPELVGSDITAGFDLEQRRKGLLWYATYVVDFAATYRVRSPADEPAEVTMAFSLPDAGGTYDGFSVRADGREVPVDYRGGVAYAQFPVAPGKTVSVQTGYRTNGMDRWVYLPSPAGADVVRDFSLVMTTDFAKIDYPGDGTSPTSADQSGDGWVLTWDYESVVSGRPIGLVMPAPLNPGPLVSRITFFAPVSLLFFFAALVLLTATAGLKLHPVHYGFLAAAFFAFDLLLAYLADQVDINLAFVLAAVTSVALVVGYLRVVVGKTRALAEIAACHFVFLVLFSYSFFFSGFTGLAITIGAILTLAFFMAKTARVDWETVFPQKAPRVAAFPPPAPSGSHAPYPPAPAAPPAAPEAPGPRA